jgi:hypothetical protein
LVAAIAVIAAMSSCNPLVRNSITQVYPQTKQPSEIKVLELGSPEPLQAEKIGSIAVEEGGFTTNCSYEVVLQYARVEAARSGGDMIRITDHKTPNFWSTCHRIAADVYRYSFESLPLDTPATASPAEYYVEPSAQTPAQTSAPLRVTKMIDGDRKNWRIALSAGYSNRLAKVADLDDPFLEDYLKELKSGYFISAEIGASVNESFAIGMRYDQMRSSNAAAVTFTPDDPNEPQISGILKDDVRITFIGPQLQWRLLSKNEKVEFLWGFSLGYLGYQQENEVLGLETLFTGSTLGTRIDIDVDFRIHPNVALGFGVGLGSGTITKMEVEQGGTTKTITAEPGEGEGLVRLDLGGGVRFIF